MHSIAPLKWRFPFVPFINDKNEELMHSPIPLLACCIDTPTMNQSTGRVESKYLNHRTKESEGGPIIHVNLDKNEMYGKPKVDFKKLAEEKLYLKRIKECRMKIIEILNEKVVLREVWGEEIREGRERCRVFMDTIKELMEDIFVKALDRKKLEEGKRHNNDFKETIELELKSHKNDPAIAVLLSSQAYQYFLEQM